MSRLASLFLPGKSFCATVSHTLLLVLALTLGYAGIAHADPFANGAFITFEQSSWKSDPTAISLLNTDFASVYAPSGVLTVGLPNTGFTMDFTGPSRLLVFLPAGGSPGPLTSNTLNPSTTPAGSFGGDVVALRLNIDFSNSGFLVGTSGLHFGDLVLQNFTTLTALNGLTVSQFLADANSCLGGGACLYSFATMDTITADLNLSFDGGGGAAGFHPGVPSTFAQTNLVTPVPEPSGLLLLTTGLLGLGWTRRFKRNR